MKTQNIILTIAFSLLACFAFAQSNRTERPVSKGVQKIANRDWLTQEHLLTVTSVGYPSWIISKEVQLTSNRLTKTAAPGNMVSIGYPSWIISKDVHKTPARSAKRNLPKPVGDVIADL